MIRAALAAACLVLAGPAPAQAGSALRLCATEPVRSVAEQDRLLQVATLLRDALAAADQPAALVARAGTPALARFGVRYTHAAVSLRDNPLGPWAVRQLYFACDEQRVRLFDQGLAGFLMGADERERGFVSLLLLPTEAAVPLAAAALDTPAAQRLLSGRYVANAHPQDLLRLNCNQWLAELLAQAWAPPTQGRAAAQAVLGVWGYAPEPLHYGNPLWRVVASVVPWLSFAGHPPRDDHSLVTSLPPDLERLAQRLWPQAERLELCYTPAQAVLRRGGAPLGDDCQPAAGDRTLRFAPS